MRVPVTWMLPVAPEVVMPAVEPMPSVPAAASVKAPAPVTSGVGKPQLSVPLTVKVRLPATGKLLLRVRGGVRTPER